MTQQTCGPSLSSTMCKRRKCLLGAFGVILLPTLSSPHHTLVSTVMGHEELRGLESYWQLTNERLRHHVVYLTLRTECWHVWSRKPSGEGWDSKSASIHALLSILVRLTLYLLSCWMKQLQKGLFSSLSVQKRSYVTMVTCGGVIREQPVMWPDHRNPDELQQKENTISLTQRVTTDRTAPGNC